MLQGFAADDAFLILAKGIFRITLDREDAKERERKRGGRRGGGRKRESRGWQFPVITANPYFIA